MPQLLVPGRLIAASDDGVLLSGNDLQRILALSPSALYWPANGSGWQGTSGGTLSASGQPVGLLPDLSQLGGKTQAEWLASAPAISNNGLFGTYTNNGDGTYTIGSGNSLRVVFPLASLVNNRVYESTFEVVARSGTTSCDWCDTVSVAITETGQQKVYGARATYDSTFRFFDINAGAASSITVRLPTIKELPGNHLRAGTWASPSDAARGTLQVSAGKSWIDPDATNDQYSFLSALSARAIVARVRVPTGIVDNDRFLVNDGETDVLTTVAASSTWSATGSGAIRVNGAASANYTADVWHTLTVEWGSSQAFSRIWYSATGSRFGSMDIAALAVFNSALSSGDRATAESIIGTTA